MSDFPNFDVQGKVWQKIHNTPLATRIEKDFGVHHLYGLSSFMGDDARAFAQGFGRLNQIQSADRRAGAYGVRYGESAVKNSEQYQKVKEDSATRTSRMAAPVFKNVNPQQIDPVLNVLRGFGIQVVNPKDQSPDDRKAYLDLIQKQYGHDKAALDYYYFLYYMYLAGCYYLVEITRQLLLHGGRSLSGDEMTRVMLEIYKNKDNAFKWNESGSKNFVELFDKVSDKVSIHAGDALYASGTYKKVVVDALKSTGIISDQRDSDYWQAEKIGGVHWILKGKNGEFIDPLRGRSGRNADKRAEYTGLDLDWYKR